MTFISSTGECPDKQQTGWLKTCRTEEEEPFPYCRSLRFCLPHVVNITLWLSHSAFHVMSFLLGLISSTHDWAERAPPLCPSLSGEKLEEKLCLSLIPLIYWKIWNRLQVVLFVDSVVHVGKEARLFLMERGFRSQHQLLFKAFSSDSSFFAIMHNYAATCCHARTQTQTDRLLFLGEVLHCRLWELCMFDRVLKIKFPFGCLQFLPIISEDLESIWR